VLCSPFFLGLAGLYEPLHHKYRPQTFAQLVGQGAIASTLTHALEQNRIAPAYLFCGPRGTGKTSSARILAKSLNCLSANAPTPEPCGQCDLCRSVNRGNALDIVEIDAASNTGVDNIRELIERAQFAPVQCRYKLYVLDEVHMLSTAAFNALLKTLEEPPDNVVFVLATTDPQRVLPTIISRCQRFDFRRIPLPAMIKHLSYIAQAESINIAEGALQLVAQISQGGLRDAESLLDQLSLQSDEITVETVWDLVGAVPERDLLNLVRAIAADDSTALLDRTRHLMDKGREPLIVLQSLVGFYRDLLIAKSAPNRADMVAITPPTWAEMTDFVKSLSAAQLLASQQRLQQAEGQVKNTTQPRLWLEISLTGLLPSALGAAAQAGSVGLGGGLGSAQANRALLAAPPAVPLPISPPPVQPSPSGKPPVGLSDGLSDRKMGGISEPSKSSAPDAQNDAQSNAPTVPPTAPPTGPPLESDVPSVSNLGAESPAKADDLDALPAEGNEPPLANDPPLPPTLSFGTLDELWEKILAALNPRGTQMLMSQQGVLLDFDGVVAKVGFRSASLQKMAQERIPNLERAFEAVFQRPIKVSLEVLKSEEPPEKKPDQPASNAPSAAPTGNSVPPAYKPPELPRVDPVRPSPQKGEGQVRPSEAPSGLPSVNPSVNGNGNGNGAKPAERADNGVHPPAINSSPSAAAAPMEEDMDQWVINQDQDNIKRFAQFFNGQIVNLDEEVDGFSGLSDNRQKSSKPGSGPGPDVPF
jgi:DNA polymerase III subunit gamma/tau